MISSIVRSDGQGQSEDSSLPSQGKKTCWVLLGIIEVLINVVASELEKAADEEKIVLEKEIMELVSSYDFLEKESIMTKQRSGNRKGSSRYVQDKVYSESKEYSHVSLQKLSQARRPFFATSNIHQLLVTALKSSNADYPDKHTASQNHSQSSSCKTWDQCLKLISFALKACLRHLQSINSMKTGSNGDPLKTLFHGDVERLGQPIMQLVWLLTSGPKLEKHLKKIEGKGKTNIENKGDQLLLSLLCLNELFKLNSSGVHFAESIEDMLNLKTPELHSETTIDTAQGIDNQQGSMLKDKSLRRLHLFLEKIIKPLYSELLSLSHFHESEVALIPLCCCLLSIFPVFTLQFLFLGECRLTDVSTLAYCVNIVSCYFFWLFLILHAITHLGMIIIVMIFTNIRMQITSRSAEGRLTT